MRSALLLIGITCAAATAQDDAQTQLRAKYEAKLKSPFIEFGGWGLDYDVARATAKETGKFVFAYFSRSYAP